MLRSRPASIVRAQAVSTSAPPEVADVSQTATLEEVKEVPLAKWLELHGDDNWKGLLPVKGKKGDPPGKIDPELKETIIKYGEMAQLTYDSVDLNPWSRYRCQNRYSTKDNNDQIVPGDLFGDNLKETSFFQHLLKKEYEPVAYMYASEKTKVIRAVKKPIGQDILEDVWIGYIAYGETNKDIVVAWRGTLQPAEWVADAEVGLIPYKKYEKDPPVTEGQNGTPKTEGHKAPPKTEGPKDPPRTEGHNGPPKTEGQNGTPETDGQELSPETVREKRKSALLAGFFSVVWGGVTAYGIAFLLDVIIFRPLESEGFLGVLYTAAFAAIAALPLSKVLPKFFPGAVSKVFAEIEKEGKVGEFAKFYALAVGGLTMLANLNTSPDLFRTVDSLIFFVFVLLPTGVSAAREAWECAADGPQVHEGFYELYDPTGDANKMPTTDTKETPKNDANETPDKDTNNMPKKEHSFPRKVVHETLQKLLEKHTDTRTITVTGHSLGGALAVLSAYDIVESGSNVGADGERVQVACFAFEAPRVGNPAFKDSFEKNHVDNKLAAIRVVNKPDIVTQVPKAFFLQNVYYVLAASTNLDPVVKVVNWVEEVGYGGYGWKLPSAFQHVAPEQELVHDSREVDYLKKMPGFNPLKILEILNSVGTYHNLEVNLHMVSGYWSDTFSRDFALCNKSADAIDERAGIAPNWIATKIEVVGPSKKDPPALIEPYSPGLQSENETADEQREVGQGPVASREGASGECKPLRRDYFKSYLKDYEPEKNLFEKVRDWIAGGVAAKSPEQPK